MKAKIWLLLPSLFLTAHLNAQDFTLREILNRYYQASGGLSQVAIVRSMHMRGESLKEGQTRGQGEIVTIVKKAPDKMRITRLVGERESHLGTNGKEAWFQNAPSSGGMLEGNAAEALMRDASIQNELFRAADKGVELSLIGRQPLEVDGSQTQAYVIEALFPDGYKRLHFIHPQTFFLRRSLHLPPGTAPDEASESIYGDIRLVKDVQVAFEIHQFKSGVKQSTLYMEEVSFNTGVLDSFFDPPPAIAQN
jgi:hypothetical protein